jgi:hypothetical protein
MTPAALGWEQIEERNILAPGNIARLDQALTASAPPNIVFGFHYYYAGGCGHTNIPSSAEKEILHELEASRPGDHFTLYSLAAIAPSADIVLAVDHGAPDPGRTHSTQRPLLRWRLPCVAAAVLVVPFRRNRAVP